MCEQENACPQIRTYLFGLQIRSFSLGRSCTLSGFRSLSLSLSVFPQNLARKYDLCDALHWERDTFGKRKVWQEKSPLNALQEEKKHKIGMHAWCNINLTAEARPTPRLCHQVPAPRFHHRKPPYTRTNLFGVTVAEATRLNFVSRRKNNDQKKQQRSICASAFCCGNTRTFNFIMAHSS